MFNKLKEKLFGSTPAINIGSGINLKKRTLACLVLDESGSMAHLTNDTIGGVNTFIDSLKNDQGDSVLFSLYTFDAGFGKQPVRAIYRNKSITDVKYITNKDYKPSGNTPLYDAIGKAIADMEAEAKDGELVIVAILTDGAENASKEFYAPEIKATIQRLETKGWKFSFLGVGLNAYNTYQNIGATQNNSFNLGNSGQAMNATYAAMASNSAVMRSSYKSGGVQATAQMNILLEKDRSNIQ